MEKNICAILLCAGLSTRLSSLNINKPKCLVDINGKNCLDFWIYRLNRLGVNHILINTHHKSHQIKYHIRKNYIYRQNIKITFEKELLGTAGTIIRNNKYLSKFSDFFVIHCDMFTNINLNQFLKSHIKRNKKAHSFTSYLSI